MEFSDVNASKTCEEKSKIEIMKKMINPKSKKSRYNIENKIGGMKQRIVEEKERAEKGISIELKAEKQIEMKGKEGK